MYHEGYGKAGFWLTFTGTALTFFPMHIVGLLGMPRRVYTYPSDLGWTAYNVAETIGGYLTLAGILVLLGNLAVSYRRGAPAGADPWHGPTLEWATSSPPPEYDFAVIPKVTSAYPNWDPADREEDRRRLAGGVLLLDEGHEQPAVTPVDGRFSEIVEMPHESPWPIVLALAVSLVFVMLLLEHYYIALIMAAVCALALFGWHSKEPQEA
jgi:cytochrome c oxidase subunit 1/cytochrome c oxidase subunit I+III